MSQRQDEQLTEDAAPVAPGRVGFGRFELDLETGELTEGGRFVPLQAQAVKVLVHLVARAGRLVPRRHLIELLWPDSIVEYDQGLNGIVRDLRAVLGDDAQAPRFIETLPRQGYRFVASVAPVASVGPVATATAAIVENRGWRGEREAAAARRVGSRWMRPLPVALAALAVLLAVVSLWISLRLPDGRPVGAAPPSHTVAPKLPAQVLEDYLYGRYLLAKGSPEATAEAVAKLRTVVAAAPRFGSGRVALGEALLASGEAAPAEARRQAVEALRLDPRDARAHLLRSRLALTHEWDWELAKRHLDRARELAPGDPMTHLARAAYAASLGRHAEALAAAALAKRLDPLSATVQGDLAMFHYWAGDREGVLEETARLLEREPEHRLAKSLRLQALLDTGRFEEARAVAVSLTDDEAAFAALPDAEIGRRFLEIQEARWRGASPGALRSIVLASMAARRGHRAAAVDHLEDALRRRCPYVPFLFVDPDFRSLGSDASFQRLLADAGHPLARVGDERGGGEAIGSG